MNYASNDRNRDIVTLGGTDYQIHDLVFSREQYPRFPFVLYTPYIVFSSGQLHSYFRQYFEAVRQCELEIFTPMVFQEMFHCLCSAVSACPPI